METFGLLSAGQFENLVFRPQSQGGQICVSWAHPLGPSLGSPTWISRRRRGRRRRRRRRTNSQIQIQAPPNAPRDEILPQGKPSLLIMPQWRLEKLSKARVPLAEVFHPWVHWDGPGSGFESSSGGAGGDWKSGTLEILKCCPLESGSTNQVLEWLET